MPTSGTATTTFDYIDIVEDAFEMAGLELKTGYDLKSARRALDMLSMEWANRGLNLWTIDQQTVPLVASTASYSLPADTVDVIEHVVRTGSGTSQVDIDLFRLSVSGYSSITNKNSQGRPIQIYVDRQRAQPTVYVWPVPDVSSTYTLVYNRLRRIQDTGAATNTPDIPFRFVPALTAGLAYYIAMRRPQAMERVPYLGEFYEKQFNLAADEDRSRATWYHHPSIERV